MKLHTWAAALSVVIGAALASGCDRPQSPEKPAPGSGVAQPKTSPSGAASGSSAGQTPSGGASGQASEGSTDKDRAPKRPSSKY